MTHRGPDDAGEWWSADGRVGLAHRRLAIIDLSPAGHQPMHDASGMLSIIFNGEIYNFQELRSQLKGKGHQFRSHSDTEVILAAYCEWGTDCLSHLNGMFAFALWDEAQQKLFCARDHLGVKPFYYFQTSEFIVFASESKALRGFHGNRLDSVGLASYLLSSYVPSGFS